MPVVPRCSACRFALFLSAFTTQGAVACHRLDSEAPSHSAPPSYAAPKPIAAAAVPAGRPGEPAASGFAVVELFTSEGCSSCPPADRNLARIAKQYRGRPVYALSFHVDYWNYLGWRDPYASAAFSERQQSYARLLEARGVYTPQMVINGTTEFVGSDETRADDTIDAALDARSPISLRVTAVGEISTVRVTFDAPGAPGTSRITAAAFQRGATLDVPRGENQGRQLSHVNVVRALRVGRLSDEGKGELSLELPSDVSRAELGFVGWVFDAKTMKITAAQGATLSPAASTVAAH